MTDELDFELQQRLRDAASRVVPKADGYETVQVGGRRRQDRQRTLVSVSAVVLFLGALGGGAMALSRLGGDGGEILVAQQGQDSGDGAVESTVATAVEPEPGDVTQPPNPDGATTTASSGDDGGDSATVDTEAGDSDRTTTTRQSDEGNGSDTTVPAPPGSVTSDYPETTDTTGGTVTEGPDTERVPLTTIPLPGDADASEPTWDYEFNFGAIQQWVSSKGQECVRLYSPIQRDPGQPDVTNLQQANFENCHDYITADDDWYVNVSDDGRLMFLQYALPPNNVVAAWVSDSSGYRVPGIVDDGMWAFDVYWNAVPASIHLQDASGGETTIDLPPSSQQSSVLRYFIGRALVPG